MVQAIKTDVHFPNLGLSFHDFGNGISIFGFNIAYYGIIIMCGMLLGVLLARHRAKISGQNVELYEDFALYAILFAVVGARLYYVIFAWDSFKDNLWSIFDLRSGGLAIYGGVIGGVLTGIVYAKVKKVNLGLLGDTCMPAMLLGQIIGRWGNFFNREAFGKYTDGLFAMQLDLRAVSSDYTCSLATLESRYAGKEEALQNILEIRNNTVLVDGIEYIQVHPTFLYESLWNLVVMLLLILYTPKKKFDGEILFLYFVGYGLGRVWIEGLRTDQLFLWGTPFAVSQLLSALLVAGGLIAIIVTRIKRRKQAK